MTHFHRARRRNHSKWAFTPTEQELALLMEWGKTKEIRRPASIIRSIVREYFQTTQGVTFEEMPRHGGFRGHRPKSGDTVRFRASYKVLDSKEKETVEAGETGIIKDVNRHLAIVGVEDGIVAARFRDLEIVRDGDTFI